MREGHHMGWPLQCQFGNLFCAQCAIINADIVDDALKISLAAAPQANLNIRAQNSIDCLIPNAARSIPNPVNIQPNLTNIR